MMCSVLSNKGVWIRQGKMAWSREGLFRRDKPQEYLSTVGMTHRGISRWTHIEVSSLRGRYCYQSQGMEELCHQDKSNDLRTGEVTLIEKACVG